MLWRQGEEDGWSQPGPLAARAPSTRMLQQAPVGQWARPRPAQGPEGTGVRVRGCSLSTKGDWTGDTEEQWKTPVPLDMPEVLVGWGSYGYQGIQHQRASHEYLKPKRVRGVLLGY